MWPYPRDSYGSEKPYVPPVYKEFQVILTMQDGVQLTRSARLPETAPAESIVTEILSPFTFEAGNGVFYPRHSVVSVRVQ